MVQQAIHSFNTRFESLFKSSRMTESKSLHTVKSPTCRMSLSFLVSSVPHSVVRSAIFTSLSPNASFGVSSPNLKSNQNEYEINSL